MGSSFGVPFPDPRDQMIMDRNGYTGQGPLIPRRRRPEDDYGQDQMDPEFAPPAGGVPPRQSAPSPLPDSGYGELTDLTHDPRRSPHAKGVGYRILGALANVNPIAAQFSDDITYGTKGAEGRRDWQRDVKLQQMRNQAGQHEQQNVLHGRQMDDTAAYRQMQQDENNRWHNIQDDNRDQAIYSAASNRVTQQGGRAPMPDIPTEYGTIPGRSVGAGGGRMETLPPRRGMPNESVYVPSPGQWKREQAEAKGGTIDPAEKKYIGAILKGLPPENPLHAAADDIINTPDGQRLTEAQIRMWQHVTDSAQKLSGADTRANNFSLGPQQERFKGGTKVAENTNVPRRISTSTTTHTGGTGGRAGGTAKTAKAELDSKAEAHYSRIAGANPDKPYDELMKVIAADPQVQKDGLTSQTQGKARPIKPSGGGGSKKGEAGRKILESLGVKLKSEQGDTPPPPAAAGGRVRVKNKATGQTGTVEARDFDPNKYDKL